MALRKFFLSLCCLSVVVSVWAKDRRPVRHTATLAGTVVLAAGDDQFDARVYNLEMPEIEGGEEAELLDRIKIRSAMQYPRHKQSFRNKTTAAVAPILGINFVADSNSGIPPDNYMAISAGRKAVSVINQTIAVHDATTGNYLYRNSLKYFSRTIGLNNAFNDYRFDPKIMYDPEADKYICVMLNGINGSNYIVIGFSQTNNPVGAWNFYKFYGNYTGDTTWFDYPAISMTHKEFFLTGNKIKFDSSWQAGFSQTVIYQINKSQGYNGDSTLDYQIWDSISHMGRNIRCLHPVKPGDAINGPDQYFLSNRNFDISNDTVFLVHLPDTIGGSGSLSITPLVASLPYGVPPDGRQPDTAHTLATNDGRILGAYFRGDEIQFVSTSVAPASGAAGVYHGIISNVSGSPSVTGHIYSIDSLDMGYPNLSFTGYSGVGHNKSIISFNYSGSNTYPSFGGIYFDGSSYSDITVVKGGDSSISVLAQKQQRWGDYSGSQPEWGTVGVVWTEGIFGKRNHSYGCYIAQLSSPEYTAVEQLAKESKPKLYPNPAMEYINIEFSLSSAQSVSFVITDASGRAVAELPQQYCQTGKNVIQFNTATLPVGTYFLKIAGDGRTVTSQIFQTQ